MHRKYFAFNRKNPQKGDKSPQQSLQRHKPECSCKMFYTIKRELKIEMDIDPRRFRRCPAKGIIRRKSIFQEVPCAGQMPPNIGIGQRKKSKDRDADGKQNFGQCNFHRMRTFSLGSTFSIAKRRFLSMPGKAGKSSLAILYQPRATSASVER